MSFATVSSKSRFRVAFFSLLSLCSCLAFQHLAQANPAPKELARLLDTPIGDHFFNSPAGRGFLDAFGIEKTLSTNAAKQEFIAKLHMRKYSTIRGQLESDLSRITDALESHRTYHSLPDGSPIKATAPLSETELKILDALFEIRYKPLSRADDSAHAFGNKDAFVKVQSKPHPEQIQDMFIKAPESADVEFAQARELLDNPPNDTLFLPHNPELKKGFFARAQNWWEEMGKCIKNQPKANETKSHNYQLWSDIINSEIFTTIGYVSSTYTGEREFDIRELGFDWAMAAIGSGVSNYAMRGSGHLNFKARYIRGTSVNLGLKAVDFVLYWADPLYRTGMVEKPIALPFRNYQIDRFGYNIMFTSVFSFKGPATYQLSQGLPCLYGGHWRPIMAVAKLGDKATFSYMYYKGREFTHHKAFPALHEALGNEADYAPGVNPNR